MSNTLTLNAKSSFMLFLLVIGVGLGGAMPQSFADHSEVTIVPAQGSGAPGCEEVEYGCFIPGVATVDLGGKVIFLNDDSAAHTFSAGTAADGPTGEFDTSMVMAGQSYEWTADVAGEIDYFCMVHPWMVGVLIVEEAGAEKSNSGSTLSVDEKLEFGAGLEETLGHFWALEQNLDDGNAELALIHATHPISELYDAMKPQLKAADPALDDKVNTTLLDLKDEASTDVSRSAAQSAIDDAKEVVAIARSTIVGDKLSNDTGFKVALIGTLLETSIAEYAEAVENGVIGEMAEFQDGSAFVWRSQVIFDEIKSDLPEHPAEEIEELYEALETAYDSRSSPSEIATITNGILHEFDEIRDEKLEFGAGLEETLGHFWALEQNLDDGNAELALIHATHPISELYDAMKPQLKAADPALDDKVNTTLLDLKDEASTDVSRSAAQSAIDDAKEVVAIARSTIVGDKLSNDTGFKVALIGTLLETSIAEYAEAVENGVIGEMAEFQDGSAFVWRSQVIFDEIKSDLPEHPAEEIEELYEALETAYDSRSSPSNVDTLTSGIIHEIDEITGVEGEDTELTMYVEEINELLTQAKQEYAAGDTDLALSLVTKAYLDNFEFLEGPLVEAGEKELMEEVEIMLREELRSMIKNGASSSEVDSQIDAILIKMTTVEQVVPEFGSIAILILVTAIIGSVLFARKSNLVFPRI